MTFFNYKTIRRRYCVWILVSVCLSIFTNVVLISFISRWYQQLFQTLPRRNEAVTYILPANVLYPPPVDTNRDLTLLYYFQKKEEMKLKEDTISKNNGIKIILDDPDLVSANQNKTSYLIYHYTKGRLFCSTEHHKWLRAGCPYKNCEYTCDDALMTRADALLILTFWLNINTLSNLTRNPNQLWIFWHDEPGTPPRIFNQYLFNWTVTYRLTAEASIATYGVTLLRNKSLDIPNFNKWVDENYKTRRNEASWFVSNCRPKKRLGYYEELRLHFHISAFGKCIKKNSQSSLNATCKRFSDCEGEQLSTSKFYLAFESQTYSDYITEKFWRTLSYGTIPVVLGPRRQHYERIAPPNSFIYSEDYSTAAKLAKYLHIVATNRTEYAKYHQWRIDYETFFREKDVDPIRFCELCYKLNTNRKRIWYKDINKWFGQRN